MLSMIWVFIQKLLVTVIRKRHKALTSIGQTGSHPVCLVYEYQYQIIINYKNVKMYKTRKAAKNRIIREYLKAKKKVDAEAL